MKLFVLDFETYYSDEYTLKGMTTECYVRSKQFETIGVGVTEPATGKRKWFEHDQFVKNAAREDWSQIAVLSHHSHFDHLILSHHYGIYPGYIFDTLSMANAVHGPGIAKNLAALGERYGVGAKGHEVEDAKGKHRADFTQEEWEQYGRYCLNDCDLTYGVFKAMLPHFSRTELDMIDITIRMFTEPQLELNVPLMQEYATWERAQKVDLLARVLSEDEVRDNAKGKAELKDLEKLKKKIFGSSDRFAQILRDRGIEPPTKETKSVKGWTYQFAKTDPFMQQLLEDPDDELRWLAEARVSVKSTGALTRTERFLDCATRGPMPVYIKYAAAHTLRWGGADSMNWQNLQRVSKKKPWSGTIRKSINAPKGYKICIADAAQIEARWTAYLAGEQWLVEAFAQGRDVYSENASVFYGRKVDRKRVEVDPVTGKTFRPDENEGNVGKTATLGFGFSLGWYRASMAFLAGPMGADPVIFTERDYDVIQPNGNRFMSDSKKVEQVKSMPSRLDMRARFIHCIVTEEIVRRWRAKNKRIAGERGQWSLWKHMEQILAWMNEGVERDYGQCEFPVPVPIRVFRHGWQLEGFGAMHFNGLEFNGKEYSYLGGKSGKERVRIHGPAATENIIQYLARCTTGEHMVKYRQEHKVPVKMMSHDEVLSLPREEEAQIALAGKIRLMKTSPSWAPGLPLNAEGDIGDVYGEIK